MSEHSTKQHEIFAHLNPHDVEQFYASYQHWAAQEKIAQIQTEIASLQQQIAENTERLRQLHPSPATFEIITQLQSYGVIDIELLDRIVERGDAWLEHMMRHLAYCQQQNVLNESYTEWCERALDGAYDWIDSIDSAPSPSNRESENDLSPQSPDNEQPTANATEEVLLRKLMSDEVDEEALLEPGEIEEPLSSEPIQTEETPSQEVAVLPDKESPPEITDDELSDPDEFAFPGEQVVPTREETEQEKLSEVAPAQEEEQEPALQAHPEEIYAAEQPDVSQIETIHIEVPSTEMTTEQNTEAPSYGQPVPFSEAHLSSPASTETTEREREAAGPTQLQDSIEEDSEQPYRVRKKRRSLLQRILGLFFRT